MRYPNFLNAGDTIQFIAPSFGVTTSPYKERFEQALIELRKKGFHFIFGDNIYKNLGIGRSNTKEKCAEEFMLEYQKPEGAMLLSVGGGELMVEILENIDFQLISKLPLKWFMGYSDNTNLSFTITTLCDIATIYGPHAGDFGRVPWHSSIEDAFLLMTGKSLKFSNYPFYEKESKEDATPLDSFHVTEPFKLTCYPSNKLTMKGRLLGGCLDVLINLVGTPFDKVSSFIEKYQSDGILWYLEACDLNVFSIRRAILQLKRAGWFAHCSGFLIGRPVVMNQEIAGLTQYNAVLDVLIDYQVPIVMDVDLGHIKPAMPLINGSIADVLVNDNSLTIKMSLE